MVVIVVTTIIVVHNTEPFALHNDGACHVQQFFFSADWG